MAKTKAVIALIPFLASCTTVADPNYLMQLQAYQEVERARQATLHAKVQADQARYDAIARIAEHAPDAQTRSMAMFALAFGGQQVAVAENTAKPVPPIPETDADKAYKWTALFLGPLTNIALGWYGYRVATTQSNNQASQSIASTQGLVNLGNSGVNAAQNIAVGGFNANSSIANSGFNAIRSVAVTGFENITPSITLSGQGAISTGSGNASYTTTNRDCRSGSTTGTGTGTDSTPPVNINPSTNC